MRNLQCILCFFILCGLCLSQDSQDKEPPVKVVDNYCNLKRQLVICSETVDLYRGIIRKPTTVEVYANEHADKIIAALDRVNDEIDKELDGKIVDNLKRDNAIVDKIAEGKPVEEVYKKEVSTTSIEQMRREQRKRDAAMASLKSKIRKQSIDSIRVLQYCDMKTCLEKAEYEKRTLDRKVNTLLEKYPTLQQYDYELSLNDTLWSEVLFYAKKFARQYPKKK